jgi:small subunit ribosomal protein S20
LANHKSAIKRVKQNERRRLRNKVAKTRIKNIVKDIRTNSESSDKEAVLKQLNLAQSIIDKGAKKGAIHKKTASRKISRLAKLINSAATPA